VVAGLPNKLIARRLDIAESTVKIHVSAILRELKVASRTQALIAVAKAGVRF
jgi:two-component system nitrate/nitrite response regulator NarL